MPDVLRRRHELRQQISAAAGEAAQFPEAASRGGKEQIVIEEAGIDGLVQLKGVRVGRGPGDGHHAHARRIEHAGPVIRIDDLDRGDARHVALDGEGIGPRTRPAEKSVDRQPRIAGGHEVEIGAARRVGDREAVARSVVHQGDQPLFSKRSRLTKRVVSARAMSSAVCTVPPALLRNRSFPPVP